MTEHSTEESHQINPGYALFQLARAFTTSEQHEDAATRLRAQEKVAQWATVFQGILNGTLSVGSRTPLGGVPAWATLEVVTGGFATGALLAGGPLLDHEQRLLTENPALAGKDGRTMLNAYFLSEKGLAQLREQLHNGHYEIDVPEEGALLVVAWLIDKGHNEAARALLEELGPYFARLRFYPAPSDRPVPMGAQVFLEKVGNTIGTLQSIKTSYDLLLQKEAIELWAPIYDQAARLLLETVVGAPPTLTLDRDGKVVIGANGWQVAEGGWPCSIYPAGWAARARRFLDEYHTLAFQTGADGKSPFLANTYASNRKTLAQICGLLERCIQEPLKISARNVRWGRVVLARYIHKYGVPGSERHQALRRRQARQIDIPIYEEIAKIVVARLAAYDKESGVSDLTPLTQPVNSGEAQQWHVKVDTTIPQLIQKKLQRSLIDSIEALVEQDIITSSDTLARVLPQITSEIRAAGITDPTLRPLYAAIYRAFRRRRSLLLLNYESQVRIEELPWVAAIERFRQENLSTRELARQTLDEVVTLAYTSFPYAILPNKLLQELRALAKSADLNIAFVDEVAADIFMGDFSPKFLYTAKRAADLLQGTLYAHYYGIDYEQVRQLPESDPAQKPANARQTQPAGDTFIALCTRRAGVGEGRWSVARNGMIIEQQHILTTQNLATLFETLGLAGRLQDRLDAMAHHCFEWICRRQQMKIDEWHGRLIMVKNTAYAWRQMIFFLSLLSDEEIRAFLVWAEEYFSQQREEFQARFRPALNGLRLAAAGRSLDAPGLDPQQARRFLGWSETKHWLLS